MDKFLEKYNLPKLNKEEVECLNSLITTCKIKVVIKNLPASKDLDQMVSQEDSTEHFRES